MGDFSSAVRQTLRTILTDYGFSISATKEISLCQHDRKQRRYLHCGGAVCLHVGDDSVSRLAHSHIEGDVADRRCVDQLCSAYF